MIRINKRSDIRFGFAELAEITMIKKYKTSIYFMHHFYDFILPYIKYDFINFLHIIPPITIVYIDDCRIGI